MRPRSLTLRSAACHLQKCSEKTSNMDLRLVELKWRSFFWALAENVEQPQTSGARGVENFTKLLLLYKQSILCNNFWHKHSSKFPRPLNVSSSRFEIFRPVLRCGSLLPHALTHSHIYNICDRWSGALCLSLWCAVFRLIILDAVNTPGERDLLLMGLRLRRVID